MKNLKNGGAASAALGGVASKALYGAFSITQQLLPPMLITNLMMYNLKQEGITTCQLFIAKLKNQPMPDVICTDEKSPLASFSLKSMKFLYECAGSKMFLQSCFDFE